MARTKAQREQERAEASVLRHRMQVEMDEAANTVSLCGLHPDWRVSVANGRATPPLSECPECKLAASGRRATPAQKAEIRDLTGESQVMRDAYQRHLVRHPEQDPLAGHGVEQDALELMDRLREEEEDRDKAKSGHVGRLVATRYSGGIYTEIRAIGRGRFVTVGGD